MVSRFPVQPVAVTVREPGVVQLVLPDGAKVDVPRDVACRSKLLRSTVSASEKSGSSSSLNLPDGHVVIHDWLVCVDALAQAEMLTMGSSAIANSPRLLDFLKVRAWLLAALCYVCTEAHKSVRKAEQALTETVQFSTQVGNHSAQPRALQDNVMRKAC